MNVDDVLYVLCLVSCIGIGTRVRNEVRSKFFFTSIGMVMVIGISGWHSLHCFLSTFVGAIAIIFLHPSKSHLVTFGLMFGYLSFFRLSHLFSLSEPPGHTNMIQMILTLKVSGLAFEKNASWKKLKQRDKEQSSKTVNNVPLDDKENEEQFFRKQLLEITDYDIEVQSINIIEIFHYTFNYIGVLTGPYYRYRTYRDYFETPFKHYAPSVEVTKIKLRDAGIYCFFYLVSNYMWPLEYALTDEFNERSFWYRFWYIFPTFFIFRMRIYTGLSLSESVCTMAGFGAYPDESCAANGEGPRTQYLHLKRDANKRSYNFTTIINIRPKDVEQCITFRESMKHWNTCVQYWLAINVYKLFPSKKYRTAATLLCSAYWHGFRPGHYLCIMGAAFYVPVEDMWLKLLHKDIHQIDLTGSFFKRFILNDIWIDTLYWIAKLVGLSYLGTAFVLVTFANIWKFYSSVYHVGYIMWFIMLTLGIYLKKHKRKQKHVQTFAKVRVRIH